MPQKALHISLSNQNLVEQVLNISFEEFEALPEYVQELAVILCSEIFLIRYNPFIPAQETYKSVLSRLETERPSIDDRTYTFLKNGLYRFWQEFQEDERIRQELLKRLQEILPTEHIITSPNSLVECATDATDLRMEIPLAIISPASTHEVQAIVRLANELEFKIVPRGGGSGLTGGAVPASRRTVIVSLSRMKDNLTIDPQTMLLCSQTGVITLNAIQEAGKLGCLFTVDPASKASSSLGGNISENAGGPFAFEYGTTIDNVFSYTMVMPKGEIIHVHRKNHPRHKIHPDENPEFEIYDEFGNLKETISLTGQEIRSPGLGKDVSNKYLGGLPGIQKEGVDGVITEACFVLHSKLPYSKTICLEFFGRSMNHAMQVIKDLVRLRDQVREQGDLVTMSALEEFGTKYVQTIQYEKKSVKYEGEPVSVLLIQLDSANAAALEKIKGQVVKIAEYYHNVDVFVARDEQESEVFWRDRHRLSAITRRTSGFKINEDVVIPIDVIPEFSDFIEGLNLYYLALAYRRALQQLSDVEGIDPADEFIDMELRFASQILKGEITTNDLADQEFELQIHYFFRDLNSRYPKQEPQLKDIENRLFHTRIMVANHMHAGDGNCHVNIPVNSNYPEMLRQAEEAAKKVFSKVLDLNGSVSGEHGIGITKIDFLSKEKIKALKAYKQRVDPKNILNPGKLVEKTISVSPYTFSFNRLIEDFEKTSFSQKEKLIELLKNIQICSRCGKCKQVCPMYYPEHGFLYHPRNKIISLGALIEAMYYTQLTQGQPDKDLLEYLQDMLERCTACGKCTEVCPVKINIPEQVINMRSFLEESASGGHHPIKSNILHFLSEHPTLIPKAAKMASFGQSLQNKAINFVPESVRNKFDHPFIRGYGPELKKRHLHDVLSLEKTNIFSPTQLSTQTNSNFVFYFPGCGAGLFYYSIGLAALNLLLKTGTGIILPDHHMCCGYPLLVSGCLQDYEKLKKTNTKQINKVLNQAQSQGIKIDTILTSCGTCREALATYQLEAKLNQRLEHMDVLQFLLQHRKNELSAALSLLDQPIQRSPLVYHAACHSEWTGQSPEKSGQVYAQNLQDLLGIPVRLSPGCCGESGLGAMTSPKIYNVIRQRKQEQLKQDLKDISDDTPIVVGCPSCKIGISRIIVNEKEHQDKPVVHTLEYLAQLLAGSNWQETLIKNISQYAVRA